jgi:uncharacterized protein YraI
MAYDFDRDDETAAPPRSERARRRRRRRGISFWIGFIVVVLLGAGALAVLFGWNSGDSSNDNASRTPSTSAATSTTAKVVIPATHNYKTTDGVNVRAGPGTSFANIATVQKGFEVVVVCVVDGESVNGPAGATNQWLRILMDGKQGYVTAAYVDTGGAIGDPSVIGRCPA